ncbi:MAG TPA: hypothetical protein VGO93_07665 [Candidatus Xenobia bacterium]|jgi:hypothetical protein
MNIDRLGWNVHVVSDPRHPKAGDVDRVADWIVREAGFDMEAARLVENVRVTVESMRGGARRMHVAVPDVPGDAQTLRQGEAIRSSVRTWPLCPAPIDAALVTSFTVRPDGTVCDEAVETGELTGDPASADVLVLANRANLHFLSDRGYPWLGRTPSPLDWEKLRTHAIRYGVFPAEKMEAGPLTVGGSMVHATEPQMHAADLVTQQLLKAAMAGLPSPYGAAELAALAEHFNEREKVAREVEARIEACAGAARAAQHVGERCPGRVDTVTPLGATVHLDLGADGFLPHRMVRLNEYVTVTVTDVDFEKGFVQVALCA